MHDPEPRTEKPDDGRYITADCGHEVYEGEQVYEFTKYYMKCKKDGNRVFRPVLETMCQSCAEDMKETQSFGEWCDLMEIKSRKVFDDDRG